MSEHNEDELHEVYATRVEIQQEPTELYKILKIGNLVSGGGEAKQVISEGYVYLNGEEETRKRKKTYAGDIVSFNGEYLQVALKGDGFDANIAAENQPPSSTQATSDPAAKKTPTKRKPISF